MAMLAGWTRCGLALLAGLTGLSGLSGIARLPRSEEHTSELQSRQYLVCRLLPEKKHQTNTSTHPEHYDPPRGGAETDTDPLANPPETCAFRCTLWFFVFFFNDTATTEIYTLSLHDALPIWLP